MGSQSQQLGPVVSAWQQHHVSVAHVMHSRPESALQVTCCTRCMLTCFAVAEQSHLCEPPEDAAPGFPLMALNPCLTWTFKLLEMLLQFHAQQQGLTKLALENHKLQTRLLKLMDKQIPDDVAEERDRVLEESVTKKETLQAQRRRVTDSYSRASDELGMSHPCNFTWNL